MMFSKSFTWVLAAVLLDVVHAVPRPPLTGCHDMTLPVTVAADTIVVPPLPDLSQPNALLGFFSTIPDIVANAPHTITNATFNIAATYCAPTANIVPERKEVQLLVHGASYTKD